METKTANVKSVRPLPNQDKYGNYSYNIEFDNGDSGLFSTKTDQLGSIGIIIGKPFTYCIEKKTSQSGKDWFKLSKPQSENRFTGGQTKDPAIQRMIIAQSSISSAVEFSKNKQPMSSDDVIIVAQKFYDWVIQKWGL